MALLMMEGYDHQSVVGRPGVVYPSISFVPGRYGSYAAQVTGTPGSAIYTLPQSAASLVVGQAIRSTLTTTYSFLVLSGDAGVTTHLTFRVLATGAIEVRRGTQSGTVLGTTASVLTANAWHFIEAKATLSDSVGAVTVRVDGVAVLTLTNVDTKNAGTNTTFDSVSISFAATANSQHDDVYIMDTTGSAPYNDFLGDCKIETLVPTGNGASSQLVGSDGNSTDNYALVDEIPASISDYVQSATVGNKDTYQFQDLATASGTVLAVQVNAAATKSDVGAASFELVIRSSGGTETIIAPQGLTASLAWISSGPVLLDPSGAVWTIANVNGAQFGVRVA